MNPGSPFTQSFGTWLLFNQSESPRTIFVTSAGVPSSEIWRGHVSVGRRSSPAWRNGRRYSALSCSERFCFSAVDQERFDKHIVPKDHVFASLGPKGLEDIL